MFEYPVILIGTIGTREGLALLRDFFEEVDREVYDDSGNVVRVREPRGYIYSVVEFSSPAGKQYLEMLEESREFFNRYLASLLEE